MDPFKRDVGAALLALLGSATALGCDSDGKTDTGKGGSANGGSGNRGGTSAATGGDDEGGNASGGSATGGSSNGGTNGGAAGSSAGGTGGRGGTSESGGRGGSSGTTATGGSGGSSWDMIGGCPSELCPNTGLPDGDTCSVSVTCCQYQRLSESQNCTCTNGEWMCAPERCACP